VTDQTGGHQAGHRHASTIRSILLVMLDTKLVKLSIDPLSTIVEVLTLFLSFYFDVL